MQPAERKPRPHRHEWQNLLQRLKNRHDECRTPEAYKLNGEVRGKWEDETANGLTRAIVDFMGFIGGRFTRVNVMGTPRKGAGGTLIFTPSTTREGTADVIGCYRSQYVAIEIKIGADRQSKAQKEEEVEVKRAGGLYIIAKTFPQFLQEFEYHFKTKHD